MVMTRKKAATQVADIEAKPLDKWRAQKAWNNSHRLERRAHDILQHAVRTGVVKRGRCEVCGSFRTEGHHDDYSQPLIVRWLCRLHHRRLHAEQRRQEA
jgi:hypothetical protein